MSPVTGQKTPAGAAPAVAPPPAPSPARRRRSRVFGSVTRRELVLRYVLLVFVLLISIGPFLWQLSTSLKSTNEDIYTRIPQLWPSEPTLDNYARVMDAIPVWSFIGNSLFVAALAVAGNVVFSTLAGFALARLRFRGRKIVASPGRMSVARNRPSAILRPRKRSRASAKPARVEKTTLPATASAATNNELPMKDHTGMASMTRA